MNLPSSPTDLNNPLITIEVIDGDRWTQINSIRAGAVRTTRDELDRKKFLSYGEALTRNHFPLIREICGGEWSDAHRLGCVQFLREAAQHGSTPMAIAGLLMMRSHSQERRQVVWDWLDDVHQKRLIFLYRLAESDPDVNKFFPKEEPVKTDDFGVFDLEDLP